MSLIETMIDDEIIRAAKFIQQVGSRTIDGAAKPESDYDFLVYSEKPIPHIFASCMYFCDDSKHYEPSQGRFNSWRRGHVNIIATYDRMFADKFLGANALCQVLKLQERSDRVAVFQAVLYGNLPIKQERLICPATIKAGVLA